MKNILRRTSLVLLCLMMLFAALAMSGSAKESSNQSRVFSFLTESIGFNTAATCGIMANMEQESGFDPTLVIRDRNGRLSGGLCQWNGSRFSNLIQFCNNNDLDYLSIPGQLSFLKHELQKDDFKHIYKYLMGVPNTAEGAYDAAYYWCYYFEIPSNRTSRSYSRANVAADRYWPVYESYHPVTLDPVTVSSEQSGQKLDLSERLTLSWTALEDADQYLVSIAKKTDNGYDWDNAWQKAVSGSKTALTLKLKQFSVGKYAARVVGKHTESGKVGKAANRIKFAVVCKSHDYALQSAKEPTFKHEGAYVYVCAKCGKTKTVTKAPLKLDAFLNDSVKNLTVTEVTENSITLQWDRFTGAAGYRVYRKTADGWVKVKTLNGADQTTFTLESLEPGARCAVGVRAFAKAKTETKFTGMTTRVMYTRPQQTQLRRVKAVGNAKILVEWVQVPGVNGYTVYVSTAPDEGFRAAMDVAADQTAVKIEHCKNGVQYYFSVKPYITTDAGGKIHAAQSNVLDTTAKK